MKFRVVSHSLVIFALTILLVSCNKKDNSSTNQQSGTVPLVFAEAVSEPLYTSAWVSGWITSQGSSAVKKKGVCWDTTHNPTLKNHVIFSTDNTANIMEEITGLAPGGSYYVRLFATNDAGTGYSAEKYFRTKFDSSYLNVSTLNPVFVGFSFADISGIVNDSGRSAVIERGFCWGRVCVPTVADNKIIYGSGLGEFDTELQGLTMNTIYYYRAYAINKQGLAYGAVVSFTTKTYWMLFVPGTYQGWTLGDSSNVVKSALGNNMFEGYFWFPANTEYKYVQGLTLS